MKKLTLTLLTLLFIITPFIKNIKGAEVPDYYVDLETEVYISSNEIMFQKSLSFSPISLIYFYDKNNQVYYFEGLVFDVTLKYSNSDPQYDTYFNYDLGFSYTNTKNAKYIGFDIVEREGGLGEYIISIVVYNDIMDYEPVETLFLDTAYLNTVDNFYDYRVRLQSSKTPFRYEDIINSNYNLGYDKGYQNGILEGKEQGIEQGYDLGYDNGYQEGYNLGASNDYTFGYLLYAIFTSFGVFLSFELLPGITLGAIISVPLVFGILFFILGKKGD